jgi:hypothetical protein
MALAYGAGIARTIEPPVFRVVTVSTISLVGLGRPYLTSWLHFAYMEARQWRAIWDGCPQV